MFLTEPCVYMSAQLWGKEKRTNLELKMELCPKNVLKDRLYTPIVNAKILDVDKIFEQFHI